ncbi:MAG: transglutaminase-like domain-containing protein [Promethearchaeota archaeon]
MNCVQMEKIGYAQSSSDLIFNSDLSVDYSITYTLNYTVNDPSPSSFICWLISLNSWNNAPDLSNRSITQFSKLSSTINPKNIDAYNYDSTDIYNNSYYYYAKNFSAQDNNFLLQQTYDLSENSHNWNIPKNLTVSDYDNSTFLYDFYTSSQPYCEANDSYVSSLAQNLTQGITGVYAKAKLIFLYLAQNMHYTTMDQSIGAKAALESMRGDCSEFSSSMAALLRALGIPARKTIGFVLINGDIDNASPDYSLSKGDNWLYSFNENSFPGHAWVQYYIPQLGWVSVDPTWGAGAYPSGEKYAMEYFDKWDFIHIITSVGGYYGEGIEPEVPFPDNATGIPEFPIIYPMGNAMPNSYNLDFSIDVSVSHVGTSQNLPNLSTIAIAVIGSSSFLIIAFVVIIYVMKKNGRTGSSYQRY